jgi:large subunit ribosomal protein L15
MSELNLHTLKPAEGSHRDRKRVGRGHGSGSGKTAGRGQKGQKSRSGSHSMRPGFEGGQMPLYMRLGKLRGPNHRKSMPLGPFRTHTTPVNVRELARFDAGTEVTPELLKQAGVVRSLKHPIKVLGSGELTVKLTVHAHRFSAKAVALIEGAGGSVVLVGPQPDPDAKPKKRRAKASAAAEQEQPEAEAAPKPKQKKAPKAEQAEPDAAAEAEPEAADEAPAEPEADEAPAEGEPVADATDTTDDEGETTA